MSFDQLRRREFLGVLGGAATAWPLAARGQQSLRLRQIGVLMAYEERSPLGQSFLAAFREVLAKLGWTEGLNIQFVYRWATTPTLIDQSAKEVVALKPDLILTGASPITASVLHQTRTIPIVFANIVDPVGQGFVASLARPGGNATGFVNLETSMAGKWLQLLKEIAPRVTRVAIPLDPTSASYADFYLSYFKSAAQSMSIDLIAASVTDMAAFETFVAAQAREPNTGLVPVPSSFMTGHSIESAVLTARYRLPAAYYVGSFVEAGGLLSYANDITDNYRRAATYVDRILRGGKPSDLPVQFPVKFELTINLRTAKALDLIVPPSLLAIADNVIE